MSLRSFLRLWLVWVQVAIYANSFYVNAIDLYSKDDRWPILKLSAVAVLHVMGLYTLYCGSTVSIKPRNEEEKELSSYCRKCRQNVVVRDHHCVFLAQCVGKHNYKYFFSYLFWSYLTATTNIYQTYLHYTGSALSLKGMYRWYSSPFLIRLVVFLGTGLWFAFMTGQLLGYQVYTLLNDMTARQHKKQTKTMKFTLKTTVLGLFRKEDRQEMKENFKRRWNMYFKSWWEFIYSDLDSNRQN